MDDSITTVSELKRYNGGDDIAVLIDRIEFYNLLRKNGQSKSNATQRVLTFNRRREMANNINQAGRCRREHQSGKIDSYITTNLSMHGHYINQAKLARIFVKRLP